MVVLEDISGWFISRSRLWEGNLGGSGCSSLFSVAAVEYWRQDKFRAIKVYLASLGFGGWEVQE